MADVKCAPKDQYKGWVYKWTNYIKGYQKRWFVLQNGMLSYYRSQAEMSHTCRGTINLMNAIVHTEESCSFVISNGGTQTFHLKASSEVERQRWVTALELAKANAIRHNEDEDEILANESNPAPSGKKFDTIEIQNSIKLLSNRIEDLTTCNNLIVNHGTALQRALAELDNLQSAGDATSKIKAINERATLFRITTNAMINAAQEYQDLVVTQGRRWQNSLQHEHDERVALQSMIEQLAKQHRTLEHQARSFVPLPPGTSPGNRHPAPTGSSDEEGEFEDALEDQQEHYTVVMPPNQSFKKGHLMGDKLSKNSVSDFDTFVRPSEIEATSSKSSTNGQQRKRSSNLNNLDIVVQASTTQQLSDNNISCYGKFCRRRNKNKTPKRSPSGISGDSLGFQAEDNDSSSENGDSESPDVATVICSGGKKVYEKRPSSASSRSQPGTSGQVDGTAVTVRERRRTIPEKPNVSLNLWSIMKNCVGRDLSKIPMPVNFNEPLSFLQRLTEDFEYSDCLDKAAASDQWEQMAWLAAFTISSYSPTTTRTGKPFNPLLGETFECDRFDDLGWRSITEQVSHHPPTCAMHAEGKTGWTLWQEFTMSSKFRGKYLQIIPLGIAHATFNDGNHYTWRKVTTTVHNIIVGKLWVDNHGEMDIVNHKTGDNCHLKFAAYSYFSRDVPRKVTGVVTDKAGSAKWVLTGTWDEHMEAAKVLSTTMNGSKPVFETGEYKTVWKRRYPPSYLEKCYNFTRLAVEMNEHENGVSPTDSRLRPDQRLMEQANWSESNKEKVRLEDKQRQTRRIRDKLAEQATSEGKVYPEYQPAWFSKTKDNTTGNLIHVFNGEYWKCKEEHEWSRCPDLF